MADFILIPSFIHIDQKITVSRSIHKQRILEILHTLGFYFFRCFSASVLLLLPSLPG